MVRVTGPLPEDKRNVVVVGGVAWAGDVVVISASFSPEARLNSPVTILFSRLSLPPGADSLLPS